MDEAIGGLENLWDRILSGNAELVQEAFYSLDEDKQSAILAHLQRMIAEEGWQPEQISSAKAALEALSSYSN
jgi:hypothetical protein